MLIITGASRGVGKQAALDFARRGAHVVLAARTVTHDVSNELPGSLDETVKQIENMGAKALAVPTNLASEDDLNALVATTINRRQCGGTDDCACTNARLLCKL